MTPPRITRVSSTPLAPPDRLKQIQLLALQIAVGDLGKGEEGANNRGEFIRFIRTMDGTGRGPAGAGAWCACFMSSCIVRACGKLGYEVPVKTSRSSQRLYKRVGKIGTLLEHPEPGDFIQWRRTFEAGDRRGHIGIVERVELDGLGVHRSVQTIEGNRGRYPSQVSRYTYSLKRERARKLMGFARLY